MANFFLLLRLTNSELIEIMISLLKQKIKVLLGISFGVFLFILFFEPFPLGHFDFNDRLLFVSGFGLIVFLILFVVNVLFPVIITNHKTGRKPGLPVYINSLIILASGAVSFVFYMAYAGSVSISFFITIKAVIICIVPPLIMWFYERNRELTHQYELLLLEKKIIQKQLDQYKEDSLNTAIEFISENSSENFSLLIPEVVFIRSADNYVEIMYREGDEFRKKLIRNTLKNVEAQIRQFPNFIRCHRICIMNLHYIEKLHTSYGSHWITVKGFPEKIPVSRPYLIKLKEAI